MPVTDITLSGEVRAYRRGALERTVAFTVPDEPRVRRVFGRQSSADVHVSGGSVSRYHAELYEHRGCFFFRDLDSKAGTRIVCPRAGLDVRLRLDPVAAPAPPFEVWLGPDRCVVVERLEPVLDRPRDTDSEATDIEPPVVLRTSGSRHNLRVDAVIEGHPYRGERMPPSVSATVALLLESWSPERRCFTVVSLEDLDALVGAYKFAENPRHVRVHKARRWLADLSRRLDLPVPGDGQEILQNFRGQGYLLALGWVDEVELDHDRGGPA